MATLARAGHGGNYRVGFQEEVPGTTGFAAEVSGGTFYQFGNARGYTSPDMTHELLDGLAFGAGAEAQVMDEGQIVPSEGTVRFALSDGRWLPWMFPKYAQSGTLPTTHIYTAPASRS